MQQVGARFRADEARRGTAWATGLMSVAGVVQIAAGLVEGALTSSVPLMGMYLVCGLMFLGIGWYAWWLVHHGYTEATDAGLLVCRAGGPTVVPWAEIAELRPIHRGRYLRVRMRRTNGRALLLVAPLTRGSRPSPRFVAEMRSLHAWWYARSAGARQGSNH
ncbi:MAG TPA: PH domain-containing protein [Actinocatenispora sp.]